MDAADIDEHLSFAETCEAIVGVEGHDQVVRISLPGTERHEFPEGHIAPPVQRTFSLMRGQISVPDSAHPFPEDDFVFFIGPAPHSPQFRIPESYFSDAFRDEDGRLIVELDGGVRLMVGDH
jgi:hypothetical protein